MSLHLGNVTVDCADTRRVANFWSAALGRPLDEGGNEYFVSIGRADSSQTGWFFIKVPEGKTAKNRMHVDLRSDNRAAEVERLIGLGAQHFADHDEYGLQWTTLLDVEGNEFCVS